jgi:hypothetical protein
LNKQGEEYMNMCEMFFQTQANSLFENELKEGNYCLPFEFVVPLNTPSSYEQLFGKKEKASIIYLLQAELFLDK